MLPIPVLNHSNEDIQTKENSRRQSSGRFIFRLAKWVAVTGVALAALLAVVLALGFSSIVEYSLGRGLDAMGLTGEFEATGSLFSHLEVSGLTVEGDEMIQSMNCDRARVDFAIVPLILSRGKDGIKLITVKGLTVALDANRRPNSSFEKDDSGDKKPVQLSMYLSYLKYSSVDARDIAVSWADDEKNFSIAGFKFAWDPERRTGNLGFDSLDAAPVSLGKGDAGVTVSEQWDAISLSDLALKEGVIVSELSAVSSASEVGWTAASNLSYYGAEVKLAFDPVESEPSQMTLVSGNLDLARLRDDLALPEANFPTGIIETCDVVFSGNPESPGSWNGSLSLHARDFVFGRVALGLVEGEIDMDDGMVSMTHLDVTEGSSNLKASAKVNLGGVDSVEKVQWNRLAIAGSVQVHSDDLGELVNVGVDTAPKVALGGLIDANLDWAIADKRLLKLAGPVKCENLAVGSVRATVVDVVCDSSEADRVSLRGSVQFDGANVVNLTAGYAIPSGDYEATAEVQAGDLGAMRASLTEVADDAPELSGNAVASVSATGNTKDGGYALAGKFDVRKIVFGAGEPLALSGEFDHSPAATSLRSGRVRTGELLLAGDAALEAGILSIPRLAFGRAGDELISGSLQVPFDFAAAKSAQAFLSQPGDITADLLIRETTIADLYRIAGREPAGVTGTVRGQLKANGTLSDPIVDAGWMLQGICLEGQEDQIDPASASLQFSVREHRLKLNGQVTQAEIEPMSIVGELPFHLKEWTDPDGASGSFSGESIDLSVVLPPTSLKNLQEWVPAISLVHGNIYANVRVSGTVGNPSVSGDVEADLPHLRFHQSELPDLKDTRCHIQFSGTEVVLSELKGTAAGGSFSGRGTVDVSNLQEPVFDLSLNAQEALFYRSEELSVRSNLAVKLTGPMSGAQVSADVSLVNSRYQKEIDLLPIAMPERGPKMPSVSGPRAARTVPTVGTAELPFANWDVDVHFTTGDPFLIVGNLATSEVHADMRISGKGRDLRPSGEVRLEKAKATLPFCTLEIDLATLSFLPEMGFDPKLSVDGGAEIDTYQVRIHVYNSLFHPEYILTSNPPLEEEDIISLIVTGATREQLETSGQGQAMAKGSKLLLEKLRQVKGLSSAEQMLLPGDLTFDIGGVNQRTGEPTATAKLKLRDHIFVLGDVDAEGQYRGVLKWAIRFR